MRCRAEIRSATRGAYVSPGKGADGDGIARRGHRRRVRGYRPAPAWNAPYALRGSLHGMVGETEDSLTDLNEALRLQPADAAAL